jgi:prepilin-type N-terminal cleavage/methylation domain-containing protein
MVGIEIERPKSRGRGKSRTRDHPASARGLTREKGFTFVEIVISLGILGLVATAGLASLMTLSKNAASNRVMTSAREVVQRNIEAAVGAPFTTANPPANHVLDLTATASPFPHWDENGGTNDIVIYTSRDGTQTLTGTLVRSVIAEPNSLGADIRRITFHLDYGDRPTQLHTAFKRALSYEMTTLRSVDK